MLRTKSVLVALAAAITLGVTVFMAGPTEAIVGGSAAAPGAYSFMASVQDSGSHFCGGSVIANDWVLTAAHCVLEITSVSEFPHQEGLTVRVGSNNNSTGGKLIPVNQVRVDPLYEGGDYDVALLHLATPVPASVAKITLAPVGDDTHEVDGTPVTVAGWGDRTPLGMGLLRTRTLYEVRLKVLGDAKCGFSGTEAATRVCAGAFRKDSCQGDSGGPLFWKGPSGQRVQIGVVSRGFLCASWFRKFPAIYSEVNNAQMRAFINQYVPGV